MNKIYYGHDVVESYDYNFNKLTSNQVSLEDLESIIKSHNNWSSLDKINSNQSLSGSNYTFLTFDDGFASNYELLLQIIERMSVPVAIFVSTASLDNAYIPYEYYLNNILRSVKKINWQGKEFECETQSDAVYELIRKDLKPRDANAQLEILQNIADTHNIEIDRYELPKYLSTDQLHELSHHPLVTIGSHGIYHNMLNKKSFSDARKIAAESKKVLENIIEKPVRYFAYPYGANDLSTRLAMMSAGYDLAFTTQPSVFNTLPFYKKFKVPRFDINSAVSQ